MTMDFYRLPHFPSRLQVQGVIDPRVERPGIRSYSKWLGLLLKIFGFSEKIEASSKVYFVNRKSFEAWKGRVHDQPKIQGVQGREEVVRADEPIKKLETSSVDQTESLEEEVDQEHQEEEATKTTQDSLSLKPTSSSLKEEASSVSGSLEEIKGEEEENKGQDPSNEEKPSLSLQPAPTVQKEIEQMETVTEETVVEPLTSHEFSSFLGNVTVEFVGEKNEKPVFEEGETLKDWILKNNERIRGIKCKNDKKNPLLVDDVLKLLPCLKGLKSLHLVDAKVQEDFFLNAEPFEHLEELDLKGNRITKESLDILFGGKVFPKLKRIDLSRAGLEGQWIQEALTKSHVSLMSLKAGGNALDDDTFLAILKGFRGLKLLHLQSNNVTSVGIQKVFSGVHINLEELRLNDNEITDLGILTMLDGKERFPGLKKIECVGCGLEIEPREETLNKFSASSITLTYMK